LMRDDRDIDKWYCDGYPYVFLQEITA